MYYVGKHDTFIPWKSHVLLCIPDKARKNFRTAGIASAIHELGHCDYAMTGAEGTGSIKQMCFTSKCFRKSPHTSPAPEFG